jgi:hypothetical protein
MRRIAILIAALFLNGCLGMADYLGPPPGADGSSVSPVDPEAVRVDSSKFARYRVKSLVSPPRWVSEYNPEFNSGYPMADILPSDEWLVRHEAGNLLLVISESYNRRQCQAQATYKFSTCYLYTIFLTKEGVVSGGWKLLRDPKYVVLSSERHTFMTPSPWGNRGWEGVTFEQIQ